MFTRTAILALIGATGVMISGPALAETPQVTKASFVEDVGASERINYSGKLRMLSQRIPSAACNVFAGIETEKASKQLAAATAEFSLIIKGLQFGEEKLNMKGEETDRKVLMSITKVHEHWGPLREMALGVVETGGTKDEVAEIATKSAPLLGAAKRLVSELVGEYSDPAALLQADALTIDIAGRQRMLAQRISKNVCLASSQFATDVALKELAGARQIYDASVRALRFGMPNAGITATSNPDILAGLDDVLALWDGVQPVLDSVAAGENVSGENRARIFAAMNSLTGQMNKLVGKYNDDSKLGL